MAVCRSARSRAPATDRSGLGRRNRRLGLARRCKSEIRPWSIELFLKLDSMHCMSETRLSFLSSQSRIIGIRRSIKATRSCIDSSARYGHSSCRYECSIRVQATSIASRRAGRPASIDSRVGCYSRAARIDSRAPVPPSLAAGCCPWWRVGGAAVDHAVGTLGAAGRVLRRHGQAKRGSTPPPPPRWRRGRPWDARP